MRSSSGWSDLVYTSRKSIGMSARRLSVAARISRMCVYRIESRGTVPDRLVVLRIADALRISRDVALVSAGYAPESPDLILLLLNAASDRGDCRSQG